MGLEVARVAEILRDIQNYNFGYDEVWTEINDDASLDFLAYDRFGETKLFGVARGEDLDVEYLHWLKIRRQKKILTDLEF